MLTVDAGLARALGGDVEVARARASGATPLERSALAGALWLESAGGAPVSLPPANELAADPLGAALAREVAGRAAFLRFDGDAHRALAGAAAPGDFGAALHLVQKCRQHLLDGAADALIEVAHELEALAARARLAPWVVEAAAFRALGELERGEVREAVMTARRAARMARTEGLPQPEYLANVALARARRFAGRPHLAVRILRALACLVSEPWLPWMAWELAIAGSDRQAAPIARDGEPAADLLAARHAAATGDAAALGTSVRSASARVRAMAPLRAELVRLAAACDPSPPPASLETPLRDFIEGRATDVPFGLMGAAALPGEAGDDIVAWVIASPERPARRIFGTAAGFARDPIGGMRPGRVEAAIAVLLLGPRDGWEKEAYFREVYGFAFRRELHQGPFEMLVHRVRKALGDAMTLERVDERIEARLHRPIAVADPRCAKPLDDRLLRALAEQPEGSARTVASALGVPLRTVQAAIKRLADEGACVVERQGRNIVYRVEDTTFSDPTSRAIRRRLPR